MSEPKNFKPGQVWVNRQGDHVTIAFAEGSYVKDTQGRVYDSSGEYGRNFYLGLIEHVGDAPLPVSGDMRERLAVAFASAAGHPMHESPEATALRVIRQADEVVRLLGMTPEQIREDQLEADRRESERVLEAMRKSFSAP